MPEPHALATIFPAVPKTVWRPGDAALECLLGTQQDGALLVDGQAGPVTCGPHIALNSGLYGVEFQLSPERGDLPPDLPIARAQVTGARGGVTLAETAITAGQLAGEFGGMYQGARLDVIVEQRVEDVEFRVTSTGEAPFRLRGVKLVPRPGRVWFPPDLDYPPGAWRFQTDRSAVCTQPGAIRCRGITLPEGEHRLGVKLRPPAGMTSGIIAGIRVTGRPTDPEAEHGPPETIAADPAVTAEAMLAHHGIPDAKLRFRLGQPYRDVSVEVAALSAGLVVQWIRIATADEAVWHHYYNLGGSSSALGQPASGFVAADPSSGGTPGSYRRFQGGSIYWTIEHGPCEVCGAIGQQYEALGGPQGDLGFPTGRPRLARLPSGGLETHQEFEHGTLRDGGA